MDFSNIDHEDSFHQCYEKLQHHSAQNFAVKFDAKEATCGINLNAEAVASLLSETATGDCTRWINFWGWNPNQTDAVKAIADHYKLSPRLMDLLWPKASESLQDQQKVHSTPGPRAANGSCFPATRDEEKAISTDSESTTASQASAAKERQMPTFRDVCEQIWHFCSVDWGQSYLYVGFNSLFTKEGEKHDTESDKPSGCRIWTSLLLCDDGTVVSVFESPPDQASFPAEVMKALRWNVLNVFRNLSNVSQASSIEASLMRVTIRPSQSSQAVPTQNRNEPASLLFYYLFDDWLTSYGLIARRQHPYRETLEQIRRQMFQSANVELIERLHQVGRQLLVLKLMYSSYQLIVRRILQRKRSAKDSVWGAEGSRHPFSHRQSDDPLEDFMAQAAETTYEAMIPEDRVEHKVSLPLSATYRFERLLDRLQLLAQTEIQQCMEEKETLTFMVHMTCFPKDYT